MGARAPAGRTIESWCSTSKQQQVLRTNEGNSLIHRRVILNEDLRKLKVWMSSSSQRSSPGAMIGVASLAWVQSMQKEFRSMLCQGIAPSISPYERWLADKTILFLLLTRNWCTLWGLTRSDSLELLIRQGNAINSLQFLSRT